MGTICRLGTSILALVALASGWSASGGGPSPLEIRPGIVVFSEGPAQRELARWAVARFDRAGLDPPAVEIRFHGDISGCGGHLGYAMDGGVDVCTVLVNEMARRNLLHEMGHIWIDQNVSPADRDRFLEFRGLRTWNASTVSWDECGYEQGAEIMAWALGTTDPDASDPRQRSRADRRRLQAAHCAVASCMRINLCWLARLRRAPRGWRRGYRDLRPRSASSRPRRAPLRSRAA